MTVGELINQLEKFDPNEVIGEWLSKNYNPFFSPFTSVGYQDGELTIF